MKSVMKAYTLLWFTTLFLYLGSSTVTLHCQTVTTDTAKGLVGDVCAIRFTITTAPTSHVDVLGKFRLSNPTVFYPSYFNSGVQSDTLTFKLQRLNDSVYTFACSLSRTFPDTVHTIYLYGESLAGSDSICTVYYDSVSCNSNPIQNFVGVIKSTSIGTPLPYVRFASLEVGYPNPSPKFRTITWAYRTDKESDITFTIYNILGKRITEETILKQPLGVHLYSIIPDLEFPTGAYTIHMKTNSGTAQQRFVIFD